MRYCANVGKNDVCRPRKACILRRHQPWSQNMKFIALLLLSVQTAAAVTVGELQCEHRQRSARRRRVRSRG